jgi:putative ABC transport system ATP-binding protein
MSAPLPSSESVARGVAVTCDNVVHVYGAAGAELTALRGVDLLVGSGESVAVIGPSGSGKSTLLWLIAGLLSPTAGTVMVGAVDIGRASAAASARERAASIGVLLQTPSRNLLGYATGVQNLLFAQRRSGRSRTQRLARADELLDRVDLGPQARHRAGSLSGGEQQRLALAVAVVNEPPLLLADEPTSQLDHDAAETVIDLVTSINRESGMTVLVVTHDSDVGARLDRTITIRDGRVGAETRKGGHYVVVGRDGSVQLPPETQDLFPPGALARVERDEHSVLLRPVGDDEPGHGE